MFEWWRHHGWGGPLFHYHIHDYYSSGVYRGWGLFEPDTTTAKPVRAAAIGWAAKTRPVVQITDIPLDIQSVPNDAQKAASPITLTWNRPRVVGNLLVSAIGVDKNASSLPVPTGWTALGSAYQGTSVGGRLVARIATNTADDNITWTWATSGVGAAAVMTQISLLNPNLADAMSAVVPNPVSDTNATSLTASLGVQAAAGLLIAASGMDSANSQTWNYPKFDNEFVPAGGGSAGATSGQPGVGIAVRYVEAGETAQVTSLWQEAGSTPAGTTRSDQQFLVLAKVA